MHSILRAAMRAHVRRMEERVIEALEEEAAKQDTIPKQGSFSEVREQLQNAALQMDDFIGSLEHRMTDFEGRLHRESVRNNNFRSGLEQHLGVTAGISQDEDFEIVSIAENTPFVFATPYRVPPPEDAIPLCPKEGPKEEKEHGSCLVWPRFLSRRKDTNRVVE